MKGTCLKCDHFIYKLMLNGYHGMCDAKPADEICFVRFDDSCDKWEPGEKEDLTAGQT